MRSLDVSPPPEGAQPQAAKSTGDAVYSVDRRDGGTVMVNPKVLLIHTDTAGTRSSLLPAVTTTELDGDALRIIERVVYLEIQETEAGCARTDWSRAL